MTEHASGMRGLHTLWIAPLVAAFGLFSYFGFFAQWPTFRDTAWLNITIVLVGVALSVRGLSSGWARGVAVRVLGGGSVAVTSALAATLIAYCYVLSYGLPGVDDVVAEGQRVPTVALVSDSGESIDLATAGESLILVFYRGFW